ncbi:hypothetical protein TYRP_006281 [Tyrophagus putrescentiae]|nr:hypothetical protein TYRP_006281 [Tyrophagus putrescentiae]
MDKQQQNQNQHQLKLNNLKHHRHRNRKHPHLNISPLSELFRLQEELLEVERKRRELAVRIEHLQAQAANASAAFSSHFQLLQSSSTTSANKICKPMKSSREAFAKELQLYEEKMARATAKQGELSERFRAEAVAFWAAKLKVKLT